MGSASRQPAGFVASVTSCIDALARRFPSLDVRMLVLLTDGSCPAIDDPRVVVRALPQDGEEGWMVSDRSWSTLLRSINVRNAHADSALGETLYWSGEVEDIASSPTETTNLMNVVTLPHAMAQSADHASALRASLAAAARLRAALNIAKPGNEAAAQIAMDCLALPTLSKQLRQMAGMILQACGRDEDALTTFLDLRRLAPGLPDLEGQIAAVLVKLGQSDEALTHLRLASSAEPFRPHLLRRLTMLEAAAGDADAALDTLASALEFKVEPATLAVDAGRALWAAHKSFHAAKAFDLAFAAGARDATFLP